MNTEELKMQAENILSGGKEKAAANADVRIAGQTG